MIIIFTFFLNLSALEDLKDIYNQGIAQWLDGRTDSAIASFEYVVHNSTDDEISLEAGKNLIILLNSKLETSLAMAYIEKLLAIKPSDPYILFEKAYTQLLLNDAVKAKKTFEDLLVTTDDEDIIYISKFFKSIAESKISGNEKAISEIDNIFKNYKPLLAPSAYLMSVFYSPVKKTAAINFLKNSLIYDSRNIQAFIELALEYEDSKYYLAAYQSYYTLREMEGIDSYADIKTKKLIKKIEKDPQDIFIWSRIGWPVHEKPLNLKGNNPIRIALFADKKNNYYPLQSFYIISNTDFEIKDDAGRRFNGKKNMQYNINYNTSQRQMDVRDNYSNIIFSTRRSFTINPNVAEGVILIKSPKLKYDIYGVNRGDREVSGKISVDVSSQGMKLINHTYIEHILPCIVNSVQGPKNDPAAIKSLIITLRTMLFNKINPQSDFDMTDNEELIEFKGLQFEKENITTLVSETKNLILKKSAGLYPASYSLNTADVVNGNIKNIKLFNNGISPHSVERWLYFDITKNASFSLPLDPEKFSDFSWLLILKPYWIEERLNSKYKIGKIKNITIMKRDSSARVISIKIEGTSGDVIINGEDEINKYLTAGSLRSSLYTLRQIRKNRFPEFFILKGAGTGNFSGLCLYGADYLSRNMSWDHTQILRYYFPDAKIVER